MENNASKFGYTLSKLDNGLPQVDVTPLDGKAKEVQLEIDTERGVIYVHMEGITVLRICKIKEVSTIKDGFHYKALKI